MHNARPDREGNQAAVFCRIAQRFVDLVGIPPMQYLAKWRMQIASELLIGGANVATVAAEIGYASEAAFSRAFKKTVGVSPSAWRRSRNWQ